MQLKVYQALTNKLIENLQKEPQVLSLVLLGSTADQSHPPDEWSDHDFFVITESGMQEGFRMTLNWLPYPERIVLSVRETDHGLKILYNDGHILEFAVFDTAEIAIAKANDYVVVFDKGQITAAMAAIAVSTPPTTTYSDTIRQRDMGMFLSLLVVGSGRVARGELISGQLFIRSHALAHLLPVLASILPAKHPEKLDNLDTFRRFEQVYPEVGAQITSALHQRPVAAALALLDIFEAQTQHLPDYPSTASTTVRAFLMRIQSPR